MATKAQKDLEQIIQNKTLELELLQNSAKKIEFDIAAAKRAIELLDEDEVIDRESSLPAKEMRNLMVTILSDAGKGLHYGEIFDELISRGISVPGKDPRRNVGAHLSNDERFEKLGEGLWGLTSWSKSKASDRAWRSVHILGEAAG